MMSAEQFKRSLSVLSSEFDIRWGSYLGQWIIEHKASYISQEEIMYLQRRFNRLSKWINDSSRSDIEKVRATWRGIGEDLVSAKKGFRVILSTNELTQATYNLICMSDMQKYGGYSRICDAMEAKEAAKEADDERMMDNERKAISGEVYDILNFLWRRKDTKLLHGEKNLNYLLHGKHSDDPIIQGV